MIGLSTAASAQEFYETKGPALPYQGVRVQNIKNAIFFATFYRDRIDLSQAVKSIIAICDDESRWAEHMVALAALQVIGNGEAKQYLARRVTGEQAHEVRRMMLAVLDDYYAAKQVL